MRLGKWIRSVRGKPKARDLEPYEVSQRRVSEDEAGVDGGDGLPSLAGPLRHKGSKPSRHVITSPGRLAADRKGDLDGRQGGRAERQRSSLPAPSDVVPEVQTFPDVRSPYQALSETAPPTSPPSLPPTTRDLPDRSEMSPYTINQPTYPSAQYHPPIGPSSYASQTLPVFDQPAPLSPHYSEHANSEESIGSGSACSDSSSALVEDEDIARADDALKAVRDIAQSMASDPMSLRTSNVDQMFASLLSSSQSQTLAARAAHNSNDLVSHLSSDMDLRSFSEAWTRGLKARVESSV